MPTTAKQDPQGAKQSGINTKARVAERTEQVEGRLAETKISRECAKSYTEKDSRVDDAVRIAKEQAVTEPSVLCGYHKARLW